MTMGAVIVCIHNVISTTPEKLKKKAEGPF
jgi:hypothetical protein